jgi:hypothetical protein
VVVAAVDQHDLGIASQCAAAAGKAAADDDDPRLPPARGRSPLKLFSIRRRPSGLCNSGE